MTRLDDIEARLAHDLKPRLPEEGADAEDVWLAGVAADLRYLLKVARAAEREIVAGGHDMCGLAECDFQEIRAALEERP